MFNKLQLKLVYCKDLVLEGNRYSVQVSFGFRELVFFESDQNGRVIWRGVVYCFSVDLFGI